MHATELKETLDSIQEEAEAQAKQKQDAADAISGSSLKFEPFAVDGGFNPREIEPRDWLSVGLLLCRQITLLISPGGVGKSTLAMLIAVAVALGRRDMIPGRDVTKAGNVLVVNSEDDLSEMQRRLAGVLTSYGIDPAELTGRFHLQSLYGQSGLLANFTDGKVEDGVLVNKLVDFCLGRKIKLIVIDPLVGFHDVSENDNTGMEKVATILRRVAQATGAAILTVHHTRKAKDSEAHAGDMDAGRGASAIAAAARIAITLARMTKEKAKKLDIKWDDLGKQLRRIDDAKQNYAPPAEKVSWFVMEDTKIANGENVGVPVSFDMSEIAKRAEAVKAQARMGTKIAQRVNTAKIIVGATTEGLKPQTEVVKDYETATKLKRTAALDHIGLLPIGLEKALSFTSDAKLDLQIWRNQVGTERRPRYQIEWTGSYQRTGIKRKRNKPTSLK